VANNAPVANNAGSKTETDASDSETSEATDAVTGD
jgi:hypothetical protein